MELTSEQKEVIRSNHDLVINAVAGSGKTTTLIEYAKSKPTNNKILYLAFNKTVKTEAIQKFSAAGIKHVKVETAHSLAYDHIIKNGKYELSHGYKIYEWRDILGIRSGEIATDLIIANHVNKYVSLFCNSKAQKLQELNYEDVIADSKAFGFVKQFRPQINKFTREALARMDKALIPVTHDFYLKKFQLSQPTLDYDYILFDEGQDASAAMLDVFLNQKATRVIVGDMHQQIYGWRFAINSLQQVDFPIFNLTNSFRFNEEIALVANKILKWKKHLGEPDAVKIIGAGTASEQILTKATLGRTNLALLVDAIAQWQHGNIKKVYFEGNINSYTFADEGASLYDVLSLYNGKLDKIRDKLIKEMKSMWQLEEYIQKTEDSALGMIVEVVKEFGNRLPGLINELKQNHTATKEEADMIFSTVHRCKGMEYDQVSLLNDFMNENKLKRIIKEKGEDFTLAEKNRLAEELNILYVAATRAKNKLIISAEINPLHSVQLAPTQLSINNYSSRSFGKFSVESLDSNGNWRTEKSSYSGTRRTNHGKSWTIDEEIQMEQLFRDKTPIASIAKVLARGESAIRYKLSSLGYDIEDLEF